MPGMVELSYRYAKPPDAPAIRALVERCYRGDAARTGWTSEADILEGPRTSETEIGDLIITPGHYFLLGEDVDGRLVATRACFPAELRAAVRQKTRWIHGIALQGWDRLGWTARPIELWMRFRDRRGPLTAIVLAAGYLLLLVAGLLWLAGVAGLGRPWQPAPLVRVLILVNFASFAWRAAMRFAFTANEYGCVEGLRAVLRIPLANLVAILAGRRALFAYMRTLGGKQPRWDKTVHRAHPALMQGARAA